MDKFEKFNKVHEESLNNIERILNKSPDDYDYGLSILGEWIMNTDVNPYLFIDNGWAGAVKTSTGFESLLNFLHHALYDDGDITFVKVQGFPKIVFKHRYDSDFVNSLFDSSLKRIIERFGDKLEDRVEVLDIKPEDFPKLVEDTHSEYIKRCFLWDVKRFGEDFALNAYSDYKCFDVSWLDMIKTSDEQ